VLRFPREICIKFLYDFLKKKDNGSRMIYFSFFLVSLGVVFVLYSFLVVSEDKPLFEKKKSNHTYRKKISSVKKENSSLKAKLFNFKYPSVKNPTEVDEKIRKERVLENQIQIKPKEPELEKIFPDTIQMAELAEEEAEAEPISLHTEPTLPKPNFVLQISGTLFLDFGRKIPFDFKKFKNIEWTEETFLHFKRIGKVKMLEHDGIVEFHTGNVAHEFILEQMDHIIFYENVFTLVPISPSMPVSIMFSADTEKFKKVVTKRFEVISV
jgi:hypothetical protein